MKTCIDDVSDVPFKCDADISERWYYNDYSNSLKQEYKKLTNSMSKEKAFEEIAKEHTEMTEEELRNIIDK
jgi:hypothetical protein